MSPRISLTLAPDAPAAARARQALTPLLHAWHLADPVRDDVLLVVTELVTNAVRHAGGPRPLELSVACSDDEVVVCVRDAGTGVPLPRRAAADAETGRGLALIEAVASRWWVEADRDGKCVSVALVRSPAEAAAQAS